MSEADLLREMQKLWQAVIELRQQVESLKRSVYSDGK